MISFPRYNTVMEQVELSISFTVEDAEAKGNDSSFTRTGFLMQVTTIGADSVFIFI